VEDLIYNHGLGDSCGAQKAVIQPVKPEESDQPSTLPAKPTVPDQPSTLPTKPTLPDQPSTLPTRPDPQDQTPLITDRPEESGPIARATSQDQCKAGFTFN